MNFKFYHALDKNEKTENGGFCFCFASMNWTQGLTFALSALPLKELPFWQENGRFLSARLRGHKKIVFVISNPHFTSPTFWKLLLMDENNFIQQFLVMILFLLFAKWAVAHHVLYNGNTQVWVLLAHVPITYFKIII